MGRILKNLLLVCATPYFLPGATWMAACGERIWAGIIWETICRQKKLTSLRKVKTTVGQFAMATKSMTVILIKNNISVILAKIQRLPRWKCRLIPLLWVLLLYPKKAGRKTTGMTSSWHSTDHGTGYNQQDISLSGLDLTRKETSKVSKTLLPAG